MCLYNQKINDYFYYRACLVASIRFSGASQSTIKLVATNLIANGKLAGKHLLNSSKMSKNKIYVFKNRKENFVSFIEGPQTGHRLFFCDSLVGQSGAGPEFQVGERGKENKLQTAAMFWVKL